MKVFCLCEQQLQRLRLIINKLANFTRSFSLAQFSCKNLFKSLLNFIRALADPHTVRRRDGRCGNDDGVMIMVLPCLNYSFSKRSSKQVFGNYNICGGRKGKGLNLKVKLLVQGKGILEQCIETFISASFN